MPRRYFALHPHHGGRCRAPSLHRAREDGPRPRTRASAGRRQRRAAPALAIDEDGWPARRGRRIACDQVAGAASDRPAARYRTGKAPGSGPARAHADAEFERRRPPGERGPRPAVTSRGLPMAQRVLNAEIVASRPRIRECWRTGSAGEAARAAASHRALIRDAYGRPSLPARRPCGSSVSSSAMKRLAAPHPSRNWSVCEVRSMYSFHSGVSLTFFDQVRVERDRVGRDVPRAARRVRGCWNWSIGMPGFLAGRDVGPAHASP